MSVLDIELSTSQYLALRAYYVQGMTQAAISRTLGCSRQNVHMLVMTARAKLVRACEDGVVDFLSVVEGLMRPSPTSNVTCDVGKAASRQEQLLDALELRMQQRALESEDTRECMSGSSFVPTHIKRNSFDQWELRFLNEGTGRNSVPSSAYRPRNMARFCACDWRICGLHCAECYADLA
jgi:hypothetical protein